MVDVSMERRMGSIDGDEESTYVFSTETHDNKPNRMIGAVETEIRGKYMIDGKDDMLMTIGAMAETQAGGMFTTAGQSDYLIGISGMRLTLMGDLWIVGLFGMEEKIASSVAEVMLQPLDVEDSGSKTTGRQKGVIRHPLPEAAQTLAGNVSYEHDAYQTVGGKTLRRQGAA